IGGRDGAALAEQMHGFEASRAMQLTNAQREGSGSLFTSARADQSDMARAMRWAWDTAGQVVDPHTAIGLHAARGLDLPGDVPVVTLATAHAAKFRDAVERVIGTRPTLPLRVGDLFAREEAFTELPGDYEAVRSFILGHASPRG
ncbi:MAG: threonine synthase, partial [Alphaproteobacteria bacterium]|nr:threonine synthase [Alphaproteobacteria bacterium]